MDRARIRNLLQTVVKFMLSNLLGTVVDTLVLLLFSEYIFQKSYLTTVILSPLISFECAVLTNYCFSYFVTWKGRVKHPNFLKMSRHYLGYNLSCTGVFVIKMAFLMLFRRIFGWHVVVCNLCALIFSGAANFVLGEWVIFKRRKLPPPEE